MAMYNLLFLLWFFLAVYLAQGNAASTPTAQDTTPGIGVKLHTSARDIRQDNVPIVILKLDDVKNEPPTIERFNQVKEILVSNNINASFGVITSGMQGLGADSGFCRWLRSVQETGLIEVFNHGLNHTSDEFTGTLENQAQSMQRSQGYLRTCGIEVTTFGAPFNMNNNDTARVLQDYPQVRAWFFPVGGDSAVDRSMNPSRFLFTVNQTKCDMEGLPGELEYSYFQKNFGNLRGNPVIVLQGHPGKWDSLRFLEFKRILSFLLGLDAKFMRPIDYVNAAIMGTVPLR